MYDTSINRLLHPKHQGKGKLPTRLIFTFTDFLLLLLLSAQLIVLLTPMMATAQNTTLLAISLPS